MNTEPIVSRVESVVEDSNTGERAAFIGPVVLDLGEVSVDTLGVTGGNDEDTGHPFYTHYENG